MNNVSAAGIFLLIFCLSSLVLSEDIKDLSIDELIKLGQDVSQKRPYDVKKSDVNFFLFTRSHQNIKLSNSFRNQEILNLTKPFKFIIHGYIENHRRSWYTSITNEYLKKSDYNIIQIDWERPSRSSYVSSAFNTKLVGYNIADFIVSNKIPFNNLHLIGHSLGSHVAGFAGKQIKKKTGNAIYRITGLDPAGPFFREINIPADKLNPKDAKIVDNIHTDAGYYGYENPLGTLDIYVNGGSRIQPGCFKPPNMLSAGALLELSFCSHTRSVKFFTESINKGKFQCRKCNSWDHYINGQCKYEKIYFIGAEDINERTTGVCYAFTNKSSPFLG